MTASTSGKTAPRLLQDLLTYDARYEQRAKRNLLTSAPPHFDPQTAPLRAVSSLNCRHALMRKDEQTHVPPPSRDFDPNVIYQAASYCSKCRWHFDLIAAFYYEGLKDEPCQKSNGEHPMHHFLFDSDDGQDDAAVGGTQTKPRTFVFSCSAPRCPMGLQIRVTPPRLTDADIHLLTDQAVLRRRWEDATRIAGDRADGSMARRIDAIDFLNTYLQDSLNPVKGKNRIPLLNRKFLKTFGKDCDAILKKLGFTDAVELDDEGAASEVWHLPTPPAARYPTELSEPTPTLRTVVEDARCELNSLLIVYPEEARSALRRPPTQPTSSISDIERLLGCADYDKVTGRATRSTNHEEDHPYYAALGAVGDFADRIVLFAYHCQVAVDRMNAPYYFEALQDIAKGRQSELLRTEFAMLASQGCSGRQEVDDAYRYFGIDPSHVRVLTDDHIIGTYKSRLSDVGPSMVEETRKQLRIIGYARDSEEIHRAASNAIETYEQALSWLDLDDQAADEFVRTMYTIKINDNPSNKDVARKAVSVIAQTRRSQRLWTFLEHGDMAGPDMDVAEAYAILGIDDRAAKLDDQVLGSSVEMLIQANPESETKYTEALSIVRNDQKNHATSRPLPPRYPLATWPVGCSNIGNTCYLNSVLQFLFTIQPLREMVLSCEQHLQGLTPEALATKRVGGAIATLERVEKGQLFVRELRKLFEQMVTAPTSSIRYEKNLAILALAKNDSPTVENGDDSGGTAPAAFVGPMPQPQPLQGSRPPTPADSAMGDCDDEKSPNSMEAMNLAETKPEPPSRPPPIPPRPQALSDKEFNKAEESARQQDAAESINNLFDLLSHAFKGDGLLRDNEQEDLIKRLFFADVTIVRNSDGKETSKTDLQDTVAVTPNDRDRNLCAAMDDEFGLSETEPGVTKYEFFRHPPPIQLFNARRLQWEAGANSGKGASVRKESHLALDKVMYMDRYMESTKSLSKDQVQELRKQQWRLQAELRDLENHRKSLKETEFKASGSSINLPAILEETAVLTEILTKESSESSPSSEPAENDGDKLSGQLRQRAEDLRSQIELLDNRMSKLEEEIDSVFAHCKDHPYRLHSIFMHAGTETSGHYWIYIYDFQHKIWRKYNDESVDEEKEEKILGKGEGLHPPVSTGIVYIREDVALTHTEAVHRKIEDVSNGTDVEMKDAVEYDSIPVINGVEGDANMSG